MEVKEEVKKEKKVKTKKIRKPLNLSGLSSDEEQSEDNSKNIFGKTHSEFKARLAETRLQIKNCGSNDEDIAEDVFDDNVSNNGLKRSNKSKEEFKEILSLLQDLDQTSDINHKPVVDSVESDVIIQDIDDTEDMNGSTARYNTRSRSGSNSKKKTAPKKTTKKKNIRRKNGRKNSKETEFDEQKAFERLDGMQAMDDIEVVEDLDKSINVSQEIEEYINKRDIEIKVKFNAVIEKFSVKPTEKFSKIMPIIADKFKEKVSDLTFRLNEQFVDSESTPESVGLTVSDIIECYKRVANKGSNDPKDPNVLSVKLRDKTMKNALTFHINKFDKIQKIIDWFALQKNIANNKFRLEFDAERLDPMSTLADCDIDDDSQIDVILL